MDAVALLEGLIRQYSPTHHEDGAVAYLVAQMGQLGYKAFADEIGNAVGVLGDGPNQIVLLGHIDTVPGVIEVRREGDALWGRGSVDAKGPLACFTAACAQVGVRPGWQLVVIGAVGEEGDSRGAYHIVNCYQPQYTVIGEPSSWERITLGYKGSTWFDYHVKRSLAHTAGRAESACEAAIGFWNRFQELVSNYNQAYSKVFDQITPTLRAMNSQSAEFYETADLRIGVRLPVGVSLENITEMLKTAAVEDEVTFIDGVPAFRTDKNNALVRAFLSSIRRQSGTPLFSLKTGTADMNIVGPAWNCPIVAYGPGDSSLDHTPEEHIMVSEYLKGVDVLADVLRALTA